MIGVTGVLRPNGEFISCSYGNHGEATKNIPPEEEEQCVYISSGMETKKSDQASVVYYPDEITPYQEQWLIIHFMQLDMVQRKQVMEFFEMR